MTKKTEICEECRLAVVEDRAETDPALAAHLASCETCRDFARFSAALLNTPPVVPERIPALKTILRKERAGRLKLILVRSLSAAAAFALAAATVFYYYDLRPQPAAASPARAEQSALPARNGDGEMLLTDGGDYALALAWDGNTAAERDFANTLASLRDSRHWNIETFNPITEDL